MNVTEEIYLRDSFLIFMDNFHSKQNKRGHNAVDGMLSKSSNPILSGRHRAEPNRSHQQPPIARGRLDDFRAANGFHGSKQPLLAGSEAPNTDRRPKRNADGVIDLSLPPAPPRGKHKQRRSWKKRTLRSLAGFMAFIVLIAGFLFAKGYLKLGQIFKGGGGAAALEENVDPDKLKGEGDGRVNILLLGKGGGAHTAPDLTDTILIASIDPVQKQVALLSIPRDLNVADTGIKKINAVYAEAKYAATNKNANDVDAENAGLDAIEKVIEEKIGIPVHYHVMVDFEGFTKAITTVGGVDIDVDADNTVYEVLWDPTTRKHYTLDVKEGKQHFDGTRALFYARSRQTSPRGDFDRTERQRKLLIALKEKVLSIGTFANPVKLSQLISDFGDHVSSNLSKNEVLRVYDLGKDISADKIASVGLADPPNNYVQTDNINGISIVRPRAGLTDFSEIQNYVRNALKDGFIAQENATIEVYNGTNTHQKHVLVDMNNGQKKYTKHYLEQRLGVTAVTSLPAGITNSTSADFVIILGSN
jgi:polyisoprenyl-teichoic acid--peptidoglycan teichoic acid transferase